MITTTTAILEENNYYPFGLKHNNYNLNKAYFDACAAEADLCFNAVNNVPWAYRFNNKEFQGELGLNVTAMDYRQYDNAIGRFNSIDTLSELDPDKSPFAFARNSPVVLNDPTGFCPECEDYYEQQGYEPSGGQTFMSSGGAEYTFNEIAGQWDRTDLMNTLDEVVITASGFDGMRGNADDRAGVDQRDDGYDDISGLGNSIVGMGIEYSGSVMYNDATWFSVKQMKSYGQYFNGNGFTGGKIASAKRISTGLNWVGKGMGAYSGWSIYSDFNSNKIDGTHFALEEASNAYSTFGGLNGAAWAIGWESGRVVTQTNWYQDWKGNSWLPWRYENLGY